jgi:hypothetical protein
MNSEVLAEAEVEHLVGLVEHHDRMPRGVERPRLQWSRRRPGVPDHMCSHPPAPAPRGESMPPTQDAMRAPAGP